MPTYFVREADYPGEQSWRLLDWCSRRGADEFSLAFLGPPYVPSTTWAHVDELLVPFRRRVASAGDRWLLTGETVTVLRDLLPGGLFTYTPAESSLEDLTVYRNGGTLLRIVTRQGVGILQIRDDEAASLARAKLPIHRRAQ
ncbi:MAG: hypothetical protein WBQ26_13560 [Gemmatimonadaceae bacterium]|nr:hypothetical protein [Gemmatimonadaceae bacterium]